jgi:hypothetical protein
MKSVNVYVRLTTTVPGLLNVVVIVVECLVKLLCVSYDIVINFFYNMVGLIY